MIVTTNFISSYVYRLYSGPFQFSFIDWTNDLGTCGPFKYWGEISGQPLPIFLTLSSSTQTFTVDSNDSTLRGIYPVTLKGQSNTYPLAQISQENFQIELKCALSYIEASKPQINLDYIIGE